MLFGAIPDHDRETDAFDSKYCVSIVIWCYMWCNANI